MSTALSTLTELLLASSLATTAGTGNGTLELVTSHFPVDAPDNALIVLPYTTRRDPLQDHEEECAASLTRKDMQIFYRRHGVTADAADEEFIDMIDKLKSHFPYTSADGQTRLVWVYIKNGPIRYEVDRHKRLVYLCNVRLVYRRIAS